MHGGHVTLTGKVEWLFQKREAEKALRYVRGVRGVFNHITASPRAAERDVRHRIVEALHRNANVDAGHIVVTVTGEKAILTGTDRHMAAARMRRTGRGRRARHRTGRQPDRRRAGARRRLMAEPGHLSWRDSVQLLWQPRRAECDTEEAVEQLADFIVSGLREIL